MVATNANDLTVKRLVAILRTLALGYLRAVRKLVISTDLQGSGRGAIGSVPGREESEDIHVEIDEFCEGLFLDHCEQAWEQEGLKIWIRSEHNPRGYGVGCTKLQDAHVECDIDPFDGTDQYRKGIREAWWSVFSFSHNGAPLVGGSVDILGGTLYLALANERRVEEISTRTNRLKTVFPRRETALGEESVVASYKGKWRYFFSWVGRVRKLFRQPQLSGVTHYGNGGSFVYALLAGGVLSAYIMDRTPGEPISEISPGAAFVEAGGLCLLVVRSNTVVRFNPVAGMEGRVDGIFIAACTEDLGQWIAHQLQQA